MELWVLSATDATFLTDVSLLNASAAQYIQVVMMEVLEVLYWRTLHSTQLQWLTTMAPRLVPVLVLSVMRAVGMNSIKPQPLTESVKVMECGLEVPLCVVCYNMY